MKTCSRCKGVKPPSEFHRNKLKDDGLDSSCKECTNERMRNKYHTDDQWRADKIAKTHQYHLDNPEWARERMRAHHVAHIVERAERARERGKLPEVAESRRDASRRCESRRRAIKAESTVVSYISAASLEALLIEFNGLCAICERAFSESVILHWDHVRPLAHHGEHTLSNLQPLCSSCNVRKNAVYPLTEDRMAEIRNQSLGAERQVVEHAS